MSGTPFAECYKQTDFRIGMNRFTGFFPQDIVLWVREKKMTGALFPFPRLTGPGKSSYVVISKGKGVFGLY